MENRIPDPRIIFDALENPKYKWRTLEGIATETGVAPSVIYSLIEKNREKIIQSTVPSLTGEALYTTRHHYIEQSSSLEKIIGAFKNRVS
jgi:hypothetical protein